MIKIIAPEYCQSEIDYILDFFLNRNLGVDYDLIFSDKNGDHISIHAPQSGLLMFSSRVFKLLESEWLSSNILSNIDICEINLGNSLVSCESFISEIFNNLSSIMSLFGESKFDFSQKDRLVTDFDLFGTAFFVLSRYEEVISTDCLDVHGRFVGKKSIAYQHGFIERPIIDEYAIFLRNSLTALGVQLENKQSEATTDITCDVDWPVDPRRFSFYLMCKGVIADLLLKRSFSKSILNIKNYLYTIMGFNIEDEYTKNIYWIMDENEKFGNRVTFFFIPFKTDKKDTDFSIDDPKVLAIMNDIIRRGHLVGVHPGYNCIGSESHFRESILKFKLIMNKLYSHTHFKVYSRMHYLRWDPLSTPLLLESCGVDLDHTMGFADIAGFRCGTTNDYKMYSLQQRRPLNVVQRPLLNMECTIIDSKYEGLGYSEEALQRFKKFKSITSRYKINYTLLWHNSNLPTKFSKKMYTKILCTK